VGVVYLVTNTFAYHDLTVADKPLADKEFFKWDIGNWQYPGGLFPSASPEQREFDTTWETIWGQLAELTDDLSQQRLEEMCVQVMGRLAQQGAFSGARKLAGIVVAGPYDSGPSCWRKRDDSMCSSKRHSRNAHLAASAGKLSGYTVRHFQRCRAPPNLGFARNLAPL